MSIYTQYIVYVKYKFFSLTIIARILDNIYKGSAWHERSGSILKVKEYFSFHDDNS